jgi:hypothetical protein
VLLLFWRGVCVIDETHKVKATAGSEIQEWVNYMSLNLGEEVPKWKRLYRKVVEGLKTLRTDSLQ